MNAINKNEVSMFKVGDKVVGTRLIDDRIFEYQYELPELSMAVISKDGAAIGLNQLRHATPEEIAAGHRIDCNEDSTPKMHSHLAPETLKNDDEQVKEMREEFEEQEEISNIFKIGNFYFDESEGNYTGSNGSALAYLRGSWVFWEKRQSEVNELKQAYSKAKLSDIQHTTLAFDVIKERDELKKQIDAFKEQALKGGSNYE